MTVAAETSRHAAYQCGRGVLLLILDVEVGKVNLILGKALGFYRDDIVFRLLDNGDNVKINARRENLAVIVVGVIAAYLGAPRRREKAVLAERSEILCEAALGGLVALSLRLKLSLWIEYADISYDRFHKKSVLSISN